MRQAFAAKTGSGRTNRREMRHEPHWTISQPYPSLQIYLYRERTAYISHPEHTWQQWQVSSRKGAAECGTSAAKRCKGAKNETFRSRCRAQTTARISGPASQATNNKQPKTKKNNRQRKKHHRL